LSDIDNCDIPYLTDDLCGFEIYGCNYFRQNVNWLSLQGDSALIDAEFYSGLYDLCDGQLDCDCYEYRARDLMQWALLDEHPDSTQGKLMLLRACLEEKRDDSTSSFFDCAGDIILMALGEIEERMGNYQAAQVHYADIFNFFPSSIDTMYAQWRYIYCDAMLIDTTFGAVHDSAMSAYLQRVAGDITRKDTIGSGGGGAQQKLRLYEEAEEEAEIGKPMIDLGDIESIAPNPLTNETVIRYRLEDECDVELVIYDWQGREVMRLVEGRYNRGNYVATFKNDGFAASTYMCSLKLNGVPKRVKIMQIVK